MRFVLNTIAYLIITENFYAMGDAMDCVVWYADIRRLGNEVTHGI